MQSDLVAHGDGRQLAYHADVEYYEGRAFGLLSAAQDETPGPSAAFDRLGAPRTLDGARHVLARAHGFEGWTGFRRHVENLQHSGEPFFDAYLAIEDHVPDRLREVLNRSPDVVKLEGTNGNDLLGMATATNDERTVERSSPLVPASTRTSTAGHRSSGRRPRAARTPSPSCSRSGRTRSGAATTAERTTDGRSRRCTSPPPAGTQGPSRCCSAPAPIPQSSTVMATDPRLTGPATAVTLRSPTSSQPIWRHDRGH